VGGSGIVSISGSITLTIGGNVSTSLGTSGGSWTGAGTLTIGNTFTLTASSTQWMSVAVFSGAGTFSFGGNGLVVTASMSLSVANLTQAGGSVTFSSAGLTLTIAGNIAIGGSGTLGMFVGGQGGNLAGTSSLTFTVNARVNTLLGSLTFTGNVIVTGAVVVWCDARLAAVTTLGASMAPPFTVSGTGVLLMTPGASSSGTTVNVTSGTTLTAGTAGASGTGSGAKFAILLNSSSKMTASATGNYYLGYEDTTSTTYRLSMYLYFGTVAATAVTVIPIAGVSDSAADTSGHTIAVILGTASAGNITISVASQGFAV
jgi:hypothetical protein